MEKPYITHIEFAEEFGMSKSTLDRRQEAIGFILPRGLLSVEDRDEFRRRLKGWEQKRRQAGIKKDA